LRRDQALTVLAQGSLESGEVGGANRDIGVHEGDVVTSSTNKANIVRGAEADILGEPDYRCAEILGNADGVVL
jgi:hypothetical protein